MSILRKIFYFYIDGFRNMTIGRTLWILILIKLFVMFVILKIFFFRSSLSAYNTEAEKAIFVREQLIKKTIDE
ncbi:MAG: DUF4492 domain-containing protein [Bacteroidales bacterium]